MSEEQELAAVQEDIQRIAAANPGPVVFAYLEALIEVACGDNPALRAYKRLQIYKGIRWKLMAKGLR